MQGSNRQTWVVCAVLFGAAYLVVALVSNVLIGWSGPNYVRAWRLSAFVVSGVLFAIHIAYEHFKTPNSPLTVAVHTSVAVGTGACLLAVAAIVNSLLVNAHNLRLLLIALVVWPIITALPAFLVALVVSVALARIRRN